MKHNHGPPLAGHGRTSILSDILLWLSGIMLLLIGGMQLFAQLWLPQDGAANAQRLPLFWALFWALSCLTLITLILARRSAALSAGQPDSAARVAEDDRGLQAPMADHEEVGELRLKVVELEWRVAARTAELQQANERLGAVLRAAEEAKVAQRQLLADMGHDLRTPLNAILNFTRFLSKERYGTLNERQQELQQRVLDNAERLLGLINAALDLRAVEGSAIIAPPLPEPEPRPLAPKPATGERPMVVVVDDDDVAQKLLRHYLEAQGYAVTAVLDSRHAIERIRQIQPQLVILDVLMPHLDGWEVLAELKTRPDISAIPVLICSIMEQQRLAITLGANDYLLKPINEAALLMRINRLVAPLATILVIDDDSDARQIVRLALDEQQYRVIEATDGRAGLAVVAAERPDLIILDLMMPGMDGFAVLEQLRADPRSAGTPVLVLTAKELTPNERDWLQARTIDCIQKGQLPVDQLLDQLTRLMKPLHPSPPEPL
ncbi:response regulator [Chloroflexales bacterium ZM16-3]|nr:response regulator [Chloroflexales bacterium ZM16-3]